MPNHVHILLTLRGAETIEKAMQFVKGGFSYRLKKEFDYQGEIWQRGFSEVRIDHSESYRQHRRYIAENPVKAGLADSPEEFPYCFRSLQNKKAQGLKPHPFDPPLRHD